MTNSQDSPQARFQLRDVAFFGRTLAEHLAATPACSCMATSMPFYRAKYAALERFAADFCGPGLRMDRLRELGLEAALMPSHYDDGCSATTPEHSHVLVARR